MAHLDGPLVVYIFGPIDECASRFSTAHAVGVSCVVPLNKTILKTVSALLVYSVRWTIRFWDCTGLPPKSMQKVPSEEVTTTQNAPPPDFEGELSLFANGTPVTTAAVKAPDKYFEETAKQARKIQAGDEVGGQAGGQASC